MYCIYNTFVTHMQRRFSTRVHATFFLDMYWLNDISHCFSRCLLNMEEVVVINGFSIWGRNGAGVLRNLGRLLIEVLGTQLPKPDRHVGQPRKLREHNG